MPNNLDTISNFTLQRGHDRRTATRRIIAAGIKPVSATATGRLYRVSDLEEVMTDRDEDGDSEGDRIDRQLLAPFVYIGEFALPLAVAQVLGEYGIKPRKAEKITVRIWGEMALAILDGLGKHGDKCRIDMPESIRALAVKHHFDLGDNPPDKDAKK